MTLRFYGNTPPGVAVTLLCFSSLPALLRDALGRQAGADWGRGARKRGQAQGSRAGVWFSSVWVNIPVMFPFSHISYLGEEFAGAAWYPHLELIIHRGRFNSWIYSPIDQELCLPNYAQKQISYQNRICLCLFFLLNKNEHGRLWWGSHTLPPGSLVSCRDVDPHGDKLLFRSIRPIIDCPLMINVSSLSVSLLQRVTLMSLGAPIIPAYSRSLTPCVFALTHTVRSQAHRGSHHS